jgi:hypothetical protein
MGHRVVAKKAKILSRFALNTENFYRTGGTYRDAASARGCVKTQKNSKPSKKGLSKRSLRGFLGIGNGNPTHEYFEIWSFHTAWPRSGRNIKDQ